MSNTYINTETKEHLSLSLSEIRKKYPNISIPENADLSHINYEKVIDKIPDSYNPYYHLLTNKHVEINPETQQYEMVYTIVEKNISDLIETKKVEIDDNTYQEIMKGFDFNIKGENFHFNYDMISQQNYADNANIALQSKISNENNTILVNGYTHNKEIVRLSLTCDEFLNLYNDGAINHKNKCLEAGNVRKAKLLTANIDEIQNL